MTDTNNMTDTNKKSPPPRTTVRIPTPSGFDIEAWFYLPEGQGPFPAVVMGHGLGAVKVGGLASFAERFCREGFAAVVIDYRQWGGSEGQQPRDELNVPRQRADYSTAIGWAAAQPNIDEHRIFVWAHHLPACTPPRWPPPITASPARSPNAH